VWCDHTSLVYEKIQKKDGTEIIEEEKEDNKKFMIHGPFYDFRNKKDTIEFKKKAE